MSTVSEWGLYEKVNRTVKTATTYLRHASDGLKLVRRHDLHVSEEYWRLLDQTLATATEIIEELPEKFFTDHAQIGYPGVYYNISDERVEAVEKLIAAWRQRRERPEMHRLILKLENVSGRSPEEAAPYLARAAKLRDEHGFPEVAS